MKTGLTTRQLTGVRECVDRAEAQLIETNDPQQNGWFPSQLVPGG